MQPRISRLRFLFGTTQGLILLAIALIALVTAIWGTLSGPMAEWGIKDVTVRLLGMRLDEAEREGRIVTLYHSIAFAVVAVLTYMITDIVAMSRTLARQVNVTVTAGYLTAMFSGLAFGYFGHSWLFHGLFLVGQALLFYAGVLLAFALWPWRLEHRITDGSLASGPRGVDLERAAFFVMTVAALGSAALGAISGSYFGNGFASFLAEDAIREPEHTLLDKAVVGHLHIMLTLLGVAITLVVGRWLQFHGILHKIAMPLMISGTIIITLGAWSVVLTPYAHYIIYAGATFCMSAALMLVIFGLPKLVRERITELGLQKPTFWQKTMALLHDPLKFGSLWQMIFMNFTVSGVGIFMAVKLEEIFRVWPLREERITLTGHWHILSGLIATIILFYFADMSGLRGRARQWTGWTVIIGSDLAFASATVFSLKRLFVSEYLQQPVVNWTMILIDAGLATVLVILAGFLLWRLWAVANARKMLAVLVATSLTTLAGGCGAAPKASSALRQFAAAGADPGQWARVPAGTFLYGPHNEPVDIPYDYEIMVTPVTNGQYAAYLQKAWAEGMVRVEDGQVVGPYPGDAFHGGRHEERIESGDYLHMPLNDPACRVTFDGEKFGVKPGYEAHPVTMVTWFGALAYSQSIGARLPTELEWEKASRGTDGRPYPWGDELTGRHANYYHSGDPFEGPDGYGDTTPVGFYSGGTYGDLQTVDARSPYGLYDVAGNVASWTGDIYKEIHYRYIRGGSRGSYEPDLRTWVRNNAAPEYASPSVGFRCVRTPRGGG